jgi:hypothetical protein
MYGWIPRYAREVTGMVCNTIESVNTWLNDAEGKGHWTRESLAGAGPSR